MVGILSDNWVQTIPTGKDIWVVPMTDNDTFHLKEPITNEQLKNIGNNLAATIGDDRNPVCKGIRIFYVDKFGVLMSSGLFVKGFSPDDWDDGDDGE